MNRYAYLLAFSAALAMSGGAIAGEIYKWVDEDGNVHYVDRPTGQASEERLDIVSSGTSNSAIQASIDTRRELEKQNEEARTRRAEEKAAAAEARAEAEKRAERCQMYRDRMEAFLRSTRLYKEAEDGEREYLDEEQMLAAREEVQSKIHEYCD